MPDDLERLYQDAKSAFRAKEYDRASELFKQILLIDENYKDTSRLLAQTVRLKRRRWYNHPLLWSAIGVAMLAVIGILLAPRVKGFYANQAAPPTRASTVMVSSTNTVVPTIIPTPISLTWKRLALGQEFSRDEITAIVQDTNDKDLLYIRTSQAGVYKSINGGVSWQPTAEDVPAIGSNSRNSEFRLPGECAALAVNLQDAGIAYCGIEKGIYRTTNAGKNWELSNPKVGWVKTIAISFHDPQVVFAGGQGFSVSKDGGQTWEQLNNGMPNVPLELKIDPRNPTILFAQESAATWTASGFPIYRSIDGGHAWAQTIKNNCALMFDADGYLICGYKKSLDEGKTWINASKPIAEFDSALGSNYPFSSTILVKVSGDTKIFVSQDRGETWQYATGIDTDPWGTIRFFLDHESGQVIYAISTQKAYRSDDFGNTWHDCLFPTYISKIETRLVIDYRDSNHMLLALQGNGILVSKDGCRNWEETNLGLANLNINTIAANPNDPNIFYAGTKDGAYVSFNGGQTWNQINDGLLGATVVYSIVVDQDSSVYAATPYGIFRLEGK